MTVSLPRFDLRSSRRSAVRSRSAAAESVVPGESVLAGEPGHRLTNTAWILPILLVALCLPVTGWALAHGTAAAVWLVIALASAVLGLPLALVVLRLLGYEDPG